MIGIGYYQSIERAHRATCHHPATRDTIYAGGLPGASYITRCKRNMAGRPSGRSTHPSPDRQPLSARKAETEVLNLPKSALLLWRTFGLVRRPYDYLNLKLSTIFAEQKRTDQLWKSLSRNSAEGYNLSETDVKALTEQMQEVRF